MYLLGQFDVPESRLGEDLLRGAVELSQDTTMAWRNLWLDLIDPSNEIWAGLSDFGLALAAVSLIFISLKLAADNAQGRLILSQILELLVWPIVIVFFLKGNGNLLSQTVLLLRDIGHAQVTQVLDAELADLTVRRALEDVTLTNSARTEIAAIFAECQGEGTAEYADCIEEKQPEIDRIIEQAEELNNGPLETLTEWSENMFGATSNPFAAFLPSSVLKSLMYAMQWAFVNILEAALLMTATLAPVAFGLSLLPLGSRAIWAWGRGFVGLFAIQLGYNIIVGLAATVVVSSGGQILNDFGFLALASIFGPLLAVLLGGGGGVALYQGLSKTGSQALQLGMDVATGFTSSVVREVVKIFP